VHPIIDGHNDTLLAATSDRVGGDFLGDADDPDLVNPYSLYETGLRLKLRLASSIHEWSCLPGNGY